MPEKRVLVLGSVGQIGSELVPELRKRYGNSNVIATGHKTQPSEELMNGPFEIVDASSKEDIKRIIEKYDVKIVYHLVSLLSAVGEKNPDLAWSVNMTSLKNVLDLAREMKLEKVFWPSSIAAFGPDTPKDNTPNETILRPSTMYGVTKVAGELLCEYYHRKYGVDVRSLRYPGIISHKTLPGGGTTDYAVAVFYRPSRARDTTASYEPIPCSR
jgi:nucleoside-diphosphate-sugar epimerase